MNILTDTNLGELVTDTVQQLFQNASFGGATAADVYFSFSWPTQVLQESIYQNPWNPANPQGSMLAVEYISELADAVPQLGRYYTPSPDTVPNLYDLILTGHTVPGSPASTGAAAARGPVPAEALASESLVSAAFATESLGTDAPTLEAAAAALPQLKLEPLGLQVLPAVPVPQEDEPVALTAPTAAFAQQIAAEQQQANEQARQNAALLEQGLPIAPPAAQRLRGGSTDTFLAGTQQLTASAAIGVSSLDSFFYKAQTVFTATQLASIRYPQLTFHATDIYPANFADPAAAATWPSITLTYQLTTPIAQTATVSFQFCRVDIVRAWMLPYLFNLTGWGILGQPSGWLSSGSSTVNNGVFPLLPVALIVGRNMRVTTQTGDVQYAAPGLQVLARVSKVQPLMPTV